MIFCYGFGRCLWTSFTGSTVCIAFEKKKTLPHPSSRLELI